MIGAEFGGALVAAELALMGQNKLPLEYQSQLGNETTDRVAAIHACGYGPVSSCVCPVSMREGNLRGALLASRSTDFTAKGICTHTLTQRHEAVAV